MKRPLKTSARERLLKAAALTFARQGLAGATTRAIAKEAGVNEVTLFRLFGSKDRLVREVVGELSPETDLSDRPIGDTKNLEADLLGYARLYCRNIELNIPLVRALIGEIQHQHPAQEQAVFSCVFKPLRAALIARLEKAREKGDLRQDVAAELLADLLNGMLFADVLRRSSRRISPSYSNEKAVENAVALVLRGAGRSL